jgi:cbb3-type cytochrome oxidase maturation protein
MTTSTLVFLLAMTAIFIVFMVLGIFWAIKSGQFDDLEGPAQRILMDEDDPMLPRALVADEQADCATHPK